MSAFFQDVFQKISRFKKAFVWNMLLLYNSVTQRLCYNIAVYILVQSEEEYSLIWNEKPLTIQTDKSKW